MPSNCHPFDILSVWKEMGHKHCASSPGTWTPTAAMEVRHEGKHLATVNHCLGGEGDELPGVENFRRRLGLKLPSEWEEMTTSEVQDWPFKIWFGIETKDRLCNEIRICLLRNWLNLLLSILGLSMVVICFYLPPPTYLLLCEYGVNVRGRVKGRRGFLSRSCFVDPLLNLMDLFMKQ